MGLEPGLREQEQIAEALARRGETLTAVERRAEALVGGGFVLAVALLLLLAPPTAAAWHPLAAAACMVALVVALRAEFDTGSGFTVPSQLAFVPLLFTLPPSLAPVAVVTALVIAYLPDVLRGEMRVVRLLRLLGSAWFSVGPGAVLSASPVIGPADAAPLLLVAALVAQLAVDFGASAAMELLLRGASLREQLREAWVYAVDVALTPVGLLVAWDVDERPWAVLALVPLLVVLSTFGRERRRRVEGLVELNNAYRGTALVLGSVIEADDGYTGEHSRGVVELAVEVGRRLRLDDDRLRNLEFGALLHDVGKVAIPKEIINKPGKLDAREWEIVKTHTLEGQRMLDQVGGFMSDVGRIVRSHHERWDGAGYPDGVAGAAIPIEARIIAVCDAWNAMTTTRSYRTAMPEEAAAHELCRCAGSQFDPRIVRELLHALGAPSAAAAPGPHAAAA
jgi:HD-GYP domain-containing protein (c-di-GMP phosphodiesterase class II)